MENPPVTYIYQLNTPATRFSKGPVTFWNQKIFKSKPVEFIAAQFTPSTQTGQFYFVN